MTDVADNGSGSAADVTITPTAPAQPSAPVEPADDAEREPPSWEQVTQLRAEAKRHRLAKNAAEQERDTLRSRVDQHDRAQVERVAADKLANPSDLWLTTQLGDLRDEDGALDADKIGERLDQLVADKPHWKRIEPPLPASFSSGVRQPIKRPKTIGEAFKNALTGR